MILKDKEILRQLEELRALISLKPDKLEKDAYERIADLEVKMSRLWGLLVEYNERGQEKLSKHGKRFGGQSRFMHNNQ